MMKNRTTFSILILLTALGGFGCGASNPTVATLGEELITMKDFETSYAKNNGGWDAGAKASLEERERFLDLLVKFRLKVKEAKSRGLLQDTSIQNELRGYELSVAQTYMIEKELVRPNLKKLYERKKEELRASHILIRVAENAPADDTLKAYERAMTVIGRIPTKSFDSLALIYSEDQSASFNKGDLGYFGTGRMVPPFEDACYALRTGETTPRPIRTQFGFHVIKVTDRRPSRGALRISFILLNYNNPKDSTGVQDSSWSLYRRILAGEDFAQLASQYSQERNSALRGGDVGFYDRDRLPPDMGELLYRTLKDSVTKPFPVPNGVYIFKITDARGIPPFEEAERDLKQQYQQMRYAKDRKDYAQRFRSLYGFSYDLPTLQALTTAFDTTKTPADSMWNELEDRNLLAQRLCSYDGTPVTVQQALDRIASTPEFRTMRLTPANVENIVDQVTETILMEHHALRAQDRHPAFANLMNEYRDGILLYRIEQDEIWQRVTVNDSLLRIFHEGRKDQYRWPDRVNFAEIYVTTDSLKDAAEKRLRGGKDFMDVAEDMTMRAGYRDKKGEWGFQSYGLNELSMRASSMTLDSVSLAFRFGAGWSIIKVLAKDPARVKTFEEAGPELTSAYQEQVAKVREQEWIASLKAKYGVMIDAEALRNAFTRTPAASEEQTFQ